MNLEMKVVVFEGVIGPHVRVISFSCVVLLEGFCFVVWKKNSSYCSFLTFFFGFDGVEDAVNSHSLEEDLIQRACRIGAFED